MKASFFLILSLVGIQVFAQTPKNVVITNGGGKFAPCEPSICVNPANPAEIVAGAVLDYVCFSNDSGKTWESEQLDSRYGVYGDPCIVADQKGRFYFFHLSDPSGKGWDDPTILDRIVCQKSKNGRRWNKGFAPNPNGTKDQDKEWAAVHPTEGYVVMTWTEFDHYGSNDSDCHSRILISASKNGKQWTAPLTISETNGNCIDDSRTVEGAVPCFGPNGEIYVSWSVNGEIKFVTVRKFGDFKDLRSGFQISKEQTVVNKGANWAFEIPGLGRANGMPITMCDLNTGKIFINWADQRNGENDTDIWMISSDDGGKTWNEKVRVNNDGPGKQQFFTWSTIDQSTGTIYCVFYDRRNHEGNATDVYLATSTDGGNSFKNEKISENPFTVPTGVFFGDYNNISAENGVVRPIWTSVKDGKLVVMTALINN